MRSIMLLAVLLLTPIGLAIADEPSYHMPTYADVPAPEPRAMADVEQLLAGADPTPASDKPLRVLLIAGPKDHKKGEHDYPAWLEVWPRLLRAAPHTEVATAWMFPTPDEAAAADVLVFYQKGDWNDERAELIDKCLAEGKGLVYIHWAINGNEHPHEFAERIGLASKAGAVGYRHGPLDIDFSMAGDHPVARNFDRIDWYDETYWRLRGDASQVHLLGTSTEDGEPTPQFWTFEKDGGRVFVSVPGHYMWSFDDPAFRLLLMRGIAWSGRRNVDRFNNLVTLDARVTEGEPVPSP